MSEFWSKKEVQEQGAAAYRAGHPQSWNPYRTTPNSRQGPMKEAMWDLGWNKAAQEAKR